MTIGQTELENIIQLARIAMSPEELKELSVDLAKIVQFVEHLNEVDIEGVMPMAHAIPQEMQWREDIPEPMVGREGIMGSKGYEEGLVRVPKIIE